MLAEPKAHTEHKKVKKHAGRKPGSAKKTGGEKEVKKVEKKKHAHKKAAEKVRFFPVFLAKSKGEVATSKISGFRLRT